MNEASEMEKATNRDSSASSVNLSSLREAHRRDVPSSRVRAQVWSQLEQQSEQEALSFWAAVWSPFKGVRRVWALGLGMVLLGSAVFAASERGTEALAQFLDSSFPWIKADQTQSSQAPAQEQLHEDSETVKRPTKSGPIISPRSTSSVEADPPVVETDKPERGARKLEQSRPRKASGTAVGSALTGESRLLMRARKALASGKPQQALRLVDEHERTFSDGLLAPERQLLRIQALRRLGRDDKARSEEERLRRKHPSLPHVFDREP